MYRQSEKNLLNSNISTTCLHNMVHHIVRTCGGLRPTNDWDWLAGLGCASKFQRVSHLGFVTAPTPLNGGQSNFALCLAISGLIHFLGLLPPNGTLPGAKSRRMCSVTEELKVGGMDDVCEWWLISTSTDLLIHKFTFRPSLAFSYIGSITARHSSSGHQPNVVAWYIHTIGRPSRSTLSGQTV